MTSKINYRIVTFLLVVVSFIGATGCKDMFKDPLKDKETGEKITLLLMDRNFITTKLSVRVEDALTQQAIENEQVDVLFTGNDAGNLINFGGYKRPMFSTNTGFVEVGYDPNLTINAQNPIHLTVVASSANYISAPQFISYTSDGIKDLVISMYRKTNVKSASVLAFDEPFDLLYNNQPKNLNFISGLITSTTGTDWQYLNLYSTTSTGTLVCNNLKDKTLYSDYGAYIVGVTSGVGIMPPLVPTKTINLNKGEFVYSAILKTGMTKCETGLTIHVERASGKPGSGVFDYKITFSDGKTQTGKVSCTFPSDNLIEQVYYPSSNAAVKIELFGDSQYDVSAAANLTNICGGKANFTVTPKSNLKDYKLITRYSCPNSQVGMALSVIGEFRKKGTTDKWTSFKFIEGVCNLLLIGDADYDFRVNIDGEYYYYTLPTDPAKVKSFLEGTASDDFRFRNLNIVSTAKDVSISTDVEFSQAVCDIIQ